MKNRAIIIKLNNNNKMNQLYLNNHFLIATIIFKIIKVIHQCKKN